MWVTRNFLVAPNFFGSNDDEKWVTPIFLGFFVGRIGVEKFRDFDKQKPINISAQFWHWTTLNCAEKLEISNKSNRDAFKG